MAWPGERPDEGADPAEARPAEKNIQRDDGGQAPVFARPGEQRGDEVKGPEKNVQQDNRHR